MQNNTNNLSVVPSFVFIPRSRTKKMITLTCPATWDYKEKKLVPGVQVQVARSIAKKIKAVPERFLTFDQLTLLRELMVA